MIASDAVSAMTRKRASGFEEMGFISPVEGTCTASELQPVAALYGAVNKLESSVIPLLAVMQGGESPYSNLFTAPMTAATAETRRLQRFNGHGRDHRGRSDPQARLVAGTS